MPRVKYEGEAVEFGGLGRIEPQGQGIKTYLEGDYAGYRYEGDFLGDGHGHEHGRGRWYRPDNTLEYEGEWQQGEYHGQGRSYFDDGTTIEYEGDFAGSMRHGHGTLYGRDGNIRHCGRFADDEPVDDTTPSG